MANALISQRRESRTSSVGVDDGDLQVGPEILKLDAPDDAGADKLSGD